MTPTADEQARAAESGEPARAAESGEPARAAESGDLKQAWSAEGGPGGALVVHGFTGNPQGLRGLAEAFADAGFTVELPRLPGHGTTVEDMLTTSWADWSAEAERAYADLASRCERVIVAGLSMGGVLTMWLAANHPEIAGIVCINTPMAAAGPLSELVQSMIDAGEETMDAIGNDVADPEGFEDAYTKTPLRPLLSLIEAGDALRSQLSSISCPVLIMTSTNDHVVTPADSDAIAEAVSGPVERVTLERSYHVATLDYDKDLINERAVEFAKKVTA
jgi:carboxylesterase